MTRRKADDPAPAAGLGFEEPPKKREPEFDWNAVAARARRRPGQWYLVFRAGNYGYYSTILQDKISALKRHKGFEVRSANAKNPEGGPRTCDLFVRYVPEHDTTTD